MGFTVPTGNKVILLFLVLLLHLLLSMVSRYSPDNMCDYITVEAFQLGCIVHHGYVTMHVLCKMCKEHAIGCADVIVFSSLVSPEVTQTSPILTRLIWGHPPLWNCCSFYFPWLGNNVFAQQNSCCDVIRWHDALSIADAVIVTSQHNHIKERQCEYIVKLRILFLES